MKYVKKPRVYYGQNAEDFILWSLFRDDEDYQGFFLDIGALDGTRFSNTYSFELAGWKGICVEAHPAYIDIIKRNRPNSRVIHAAVMDKDLDEVEFFANSRGTFSTLDGSLEKAFANMGKGYFTGFEEIKVPGKTVNTILEEAGVKDIDIVSIDVEGGEVEVVHGFDLKKYRPRALVIESFITRRAMAMNKYMKDHGYTHVNKGLYNHFYAHDPKDVETLNNFREKTKVVWTKHPIDSGELVL